MSRIGIPCLVLGFLTAAVWSGPSAGAQAGKGDNPPKPGKPKFTVGKETTYVTGPLDKDGYLDYAAALNERLRKGVTPENNANVLLWQAFGPHPGGATMPPEFFQWMGIKAPPERGEYYLDLFRYLKDR